MESAELKKRAEAWQRDDPDPDARAELASLLLDPARAAELSERFGGQLEFGTAGLRGIMGAGPNRMNRAVVRRATAGLARYLKENVPQAVEHGVVVGRDGRKMSPEFLADTAGVLAAEGLCAWVFEQPVPTPVTAFAAVRLKAVAAVMVTASHNPPEYNGYKVYWSNGAQIIPPHDVGIAAAIEKVEPANRVRLLPEAEARSRGLWKSVGQDVTRAYLDAILASRPYAQPPKRLELVHTALHGVGAKWVEEALAEAGFRVHPVPEQREPDGRFPTVRFPNPEEPGALDLASALAERTRADLVLANDPDADRLAVMARDAAGKLRALTGNEVGILLGHYLLTQRRPAPAKPLVITTIVSSAQLGEIARTLGALYDETLTGFKWIANRAMDREREEGATFLFGFEEALGYSVGTVVRDKDGIGAAVAFADLAAWCESRGETALGYLERIQRQHGLFVAEQKNFTFPGAEGAATIARILEGFRARPPERIGAFIVRAARDYLAGEGRLPRSNVIAYQLEGAARITLRPSGTEPKIKYYFELNEAIRPGEGVDEARKRGSARLGELEAAFLVLARERGQPSGA